MIQIKIDSKSNALTQLATALSEKQMAVVNTRAINVAIRKANTQYRRLIVGRYNLKYADTKDFTVAKRATYGNQEGTISGTVTPISLSRFNPTFHNITTGMVHSISRNKDKKAKTPLIHSIRKETMEDAGRGGVSFMVKKGAPQKLPFAFLTTSDKNLGVAQQVFARGRYTGNRFVLKKSRYPIEAIKTVSPFGTLTNPEVARATEKNAADDMHTEFTRQINLIISQQASK